MKMLLALFVFALLVFGGSDGLGRSYIPVVGALPTEMPPECGNGSRAVYSDGSRFVCKGGQWVEVSK